MSSLSRRIDNEITRLMIDPVEGVKAEPDPDNQRYFHVKIAGPKDTPFEGGTFRLEMFLPPAYPLEPPKVRFLTRIFHPNIDRLGRICLDVLKEMWTPALQIQTVLLSIQALMSCPNTDDPLSLEVARQWKSDETKAFEIAREWTRRYAMIEDVNDNAQEEIEIAIETTEAE